MPLIYLSCAWVAGIFLGAKFAPPLAIILIGLIPLPLLFWFRHHRRLIILASLCLIAFFGGAFHFQSSLPPDDKSHLRFYNNETVKIKGVVAQRAQSVFQGMIRIDEGASKSDADLNNKNILMDGTAQAISEPQIEVLTDDVACAHGSAVGQLDAEQLFYVQSRGIGLKNSRKLLLKAFLLDIVDGMHDQIIGALEQVI